MRLDGFRTSTDGKEGVANLTLALHKLGLPAPSARVRIAIRRWNWARNYKFPFRLVQFSAVTGLLVLYLHGLIWIYAQAIIYIDARFGNSAQGLGNSLIGNLTDNPFLSAITVFIVIAWQGFGLHALFTIFMAAPYGFATRLWSMEGPQRIKAVVARQNILAGRVESVVWAADRLRSQGNRRQAHNLNELFRKLRVFKRQILRLHQGSALPMSSRSRRLRQHQRLVVAAIVEAESRLDRAPLDELPTIVEISMKILERHLLGLNGALLPDEELKNVEPAKDWEPFRMVTAALLMAGTAIAVGFFDLPDPAITALLGATGLVSVSLMFGRGARSALDVVDIVRGQ
ncbi:hypothetical protein ACFZC7_22885 [Streptomyces massasporeus]|uniref:hypothetical protein n=1 Tax=Streptomyces massasporeus TaxID=67324 RepID=UPI0036E1C4B8